ncbi:MAG: RNA methyltransferase, partial [Lachnospiraceae bacterium]|nr:RNA methyltransferase [Lachnospiraceae bacterium]
MITSSSNQQIKNLQSLLKKAKERKEQKAFVTEGIRMFKEALELGLVLNAYYSEHFFESLETADRQKFTGIPYEVVTDGVFGSISVTVTPQGVIAVVKMPEHDEDAILKKALKLILLENLQDPGNLGTIIRTAEAAGMDAVVLSKDSVDVYNPKVVRSTMGA